MSKERVSVALFLNKINITVFLLFCVFALLLSCLSTSSTVRLCMTNHCTPHAVAAPIVDLMSYLAQQHYSQNDHSKEVYNFKIGI